MKPDELKTFPWNVPILSCDLHSRCTDRPRHGCNYKMCPRSHSHPVSTGCRRWSPLWFC